MGSQLAEIEQLRLRVDCADSHVKGGAVAGAEAAFSELDTAIDQEHAGDAYFILGAAHQVAIDKGYISEDREGGVMALAMTSRRCPVMN